MLKNLPGGFRWLKRNKRDDAIVYFETFANLLEDKLIRDIDIVMEPATLSSNVPIPYFQQEFADPATA